MSFCELLLQHNAYVDARNKRGNTPMWLACCSGSLEVTKLLQKYNADVNIPDNRGATPLVSAFKKGHTRTCAWLVKDSGCTVRLENFIFVFVCIFFDFSRVILRCSSVDSNRVAFYHPLSNASE